MKEYGVNNWYDWANSNWGTKWGVYDSQEWNDDDQSIFFMSAWSPATRIVEKLSSLFPDVEFVLDAADEGGGFLCSQEIQNGEVTSESELDWNSDEGITLREKLGCYYPEDEEQEQKA